MDDHVVIAVDDVADGTRSGGTLSGGAVSGGAAAVRVRVRGALDVETSPRLGSVLDEAVSRGGLVVVDLREVDFCDSSGIRALVRAANGARGRGAQLLVEGTSGAAQQVLEVAGVLELLRGEPVGETYEDADE